MIRFIQVLFLDRSTEAFRICVFMRMHTRSMICWTCPQSPYQICPRIIFLKTAIVGYSADELKTIYFQFCFSSPRFINKGGTLHNKFNNAKPENNIKNTHINNTLHTTTNPSSPNSTEFPQNVKIKHHSSRAHPLDKSTQSKHRTLRPNLRVTHHRTPPRLRPKHSRNKLPTRTHRPLHRNTVHRRTIGEK